MHGAMHPTGRRWEEYTSDRQRQMGTCTQHTEEAGRDSHPTGRSGQGLTYHGEADGGDTFQQAKIDGDMYPTGRDRWGLASNRWRQMGNVLNRQRQKGHDTQLCDMDPTGKDRRSWSGDRQEANSRSRRAAVRGPRRLTHTQGRHTGTQRVRPWT